MEIDNPPWHYGVRVRVMDSESVSQLYTVQRSTDGGRTWTEYLLVTNGEWASVDSTLPASLFRATLR